MQTRSFGKVLRGIGTAVVLIYMLLSYENALAETPTKTWVAQFNGPDNKTDYPSKMTTDALGNVYVTGYSCRASSNPFGALCGMNANADYATVKYDANGNQLWAARYDSGKDDSPVSLSVDQTGNVYVTGTSANPFIGEDFATVKYDANGNQLWAARYDGGIFENAIALKVDSAGNVYVTGRSSSPRGDYDFATVKYDPSGKQLWATRYQYVSNDAPAALAVDGLGNVYVTGYSCRDMACATADYVTIKYDSDGNQLWAARYGDTGYNGAQALSVDQNGNVYVTGSTFNGTNMDFATIKYDPSGNQLWVSRYDHGSDDRATAMTLDHSGNIVVTGASYGSTVFDYATVKYDPSGKELWNARYDSGGCKTNFADDYAKTVFVDGDNNVYVVGYQTGFDIDYNAVKYDANGNQIWIAKYIPQSNSYGVDLSMDASGNFYIIGGSWNGANYDYATVKYAFSPEQFIFDKVAPMTQMTRSGAPNQTGWDTTDVDISLTAEDPCSTSGVREIHYQIGTAAEQVVHGSTATIHLTEDGIITLSYYAIDQSGNREAVHTITVKIDKTPPTIVATQAPPPNAAGWNNSDVTVQFSASDLVSGGVHCTVTSASLTQEGANQIVETTCTDLAGNTAHVSKKISIDKTPPHLTFDTALPAPNASGWNNTDVSVPFKAWDDLSGIATSGPTSPLKITEEGRGISRNITVTDLAGNSATYTSPSFNIDKSGPIVTSSPSVPPVSNGWNNTNVTVSFSATDGLSGGARCVPESVAITTEGENQMATTTCTDLAGNSTVGSRMISIDKSPPALTMPNLSSSYPLNTHLPITFGATDTPSGIESISGSLNGVALNSGDSVEIGRA